jgi:hypothetical protein
MSTTLEDRDKQIGYVMYGMAIYQLALFADFALKAIVFGVIVWLVL